MLGNLPDGYEDVKTKISGSEGKFTVREIEKEILNKWVREYKGSGKEDSKKKNLAMPVQHKGKSSWKKFKGSCRKCGKIF